MGEAAFLFNGERVNGPIDLISRAPVYVNGKMPFTATSCRFDYVRGNSTASGWVEFAVPKTGMEITAESLAGTFTIAVRVGAILYSANDCMVTEESVSSAPGDGDVSIRIRWYSPNATKGVV